jgi:hypothetical protein
MASREVDYKLINTENPQCSVCQRETTLVEGTPQCLTQPTSPPTHHHHHQYPVSSIQGVGNHRMRASTGFLVIVLFFLATQTKQMPKPTNNITVTK